MARAIIAVDTCTTSWSTEGSSWRRSRVRELTRRFGREAEFEEYVELLRLEYKRKRNFIKLLDGMG